VKLNIPTDKLVKSALCDEKLIPTEQVEMRKQREIKEDGRYIIFYTSENESEDG
jgi:hypothetical protein